MKVCTFKREALGDVNAAFEHNVSADGLVIPHLAARLPAAAPMKR
jgi:hypothetical protein